MRIIGIMGAMPEEVDGVIALLENPKAVTIGMRTYTSGTINSISTVVVFSRWGKVAASATVATLIHVFGITELVFTGVAGALDLTLKIGDIVIAKRLIQHDMDARPLMERFEIPLLDTTWFECHQDQLNHAKNAIAPLLDNKALHSIIDERTLSKFGINSPRLQIGDVASGDQFFASEDRKRALHNVLPTILCVEMEGAAVAQVCYEHGIPFTIIRTISDSAGDDSHIDFRAFIQNISSHYSVSIIGHLFDLDN